MFKTDPAKLTKHERKRSMNFLIASSVFAVIGNLCISGNVLNLFAIKVGANELWLGILNFAFTAPFIFGILSMNLLESLGKRKILYRWFSVSSIFVLPLIFLPFLYDKIEVKYLLLIMAVSLFLKTTTSSFGMTGWFPLLQDIVPERVTGKFFGRLRTFWQSGAFIFFIAVSVFLGKENPWWKFMLLFAISFFAIILRAAMIFPVSDKSELFTAKPKLKIRSKLKEVLKHRDAQILTLYFVIYNVSYFAARPFIVKMIKNAGYSDGFVIAATSMLSLGAIISMQFWGKLADKFGNRSLFTITHLGMFATMLFWIFFEKGTFGAVLVFVLFLAGSIFNSGNSIAQTRYLFHMVPKNKQYFIVIINTLNVSAWSLGPLLAGGFLHVSGDLEFSAGFMEMNNYHLLFIVNALCFLIPHYLRRYMILEGDASTREVAVILSRPIKSVFGPMFNIRSNKRR